ncbi:MAG: ATP-binding protein [Pseudomonadota bacterium]
MTSTLPRERSARLAWITAATFAGVFALGYGGIFVWGGNSNSTSPIWPATAFAFVMMLRLSRSRTDDIAMLAAVLAAGLAANALGGAPLALTIGFSLINILDVMAGLWVVRRMGMPRIKTMQAAARFTVVAGAFPSLVGALLSAALVSWIGTGDPLLTAGQWFLANFLGVMLLFPFGLTVSWRQFAKLKLEHRFLEAAILFSLLTAVAVAGFRFGAPVLYLVLVGVLAASTRFRLMGAGASLIVAAVIGFAAVHSLPGGRDLFWVEMLQLYFAVCSIVGVRTAMLLNERDLHMAIIERRHKRVVRASRFKSQLLAHVSHEVRSPLSAIIGFSSMLESGSLKADRAPEFAAIIGHNGELLRRLHDDLLDLSRAEAGTLTMQPERVAVNHTLKQCVGAIRLDATLGGKDVLIDSVADTLALTCDPIRLAQILNNLIANAYKYGDNSSPIRVSARALENGFGRIEIANSGPGIPRDEHEAVFLPFRRAAGVGRNVPGAGLGLSIAKMLVEAQGGRIDFDSVPGRQTRFWIDLPLAA